MTEPYIGEIRLFGFNFAPRGWAQCDGQSLPINQSQSLFSVLGTTYGGDGRTDFDLPDLRGRAALHPDGSVGKQLGDKAGEEGVLLGGADLPSHSHTVKASSAVASTGNPGGNLLAEVSTASPIYGAFDDTVDTPLGSGSIGGVGTAHNNMQPFLAVNFCIALTGTFPPRN